MAARTKRKRYTAGALTLALGLLVGCALMTGTSAQFGDIIDGLLGLGGGGDGDDSSSGTSGFQAQQAAPAPNACCYWSPDSSDMCGQCQSGTVEGDWCAQSKEQCEESCSGVWCGDSGSSGGGSGDGQFIPKPQPTTEPSPQEPIFVPSTDPPVLDSIFEPKAPEEPSFSRDGGGGNGGIACCYWSPDSSDMCGSCTSGDLAGGFCGDSKANCEGSCTGVWCGGGSSSPSPPIGGGNPSTDPSPNPIPNPDPVSSPPPASGGDWIEGTWTTGYWDCCKPSCGWRGKGQMTNPVRSCRSDGSTAGVDESSVCDGGTAGACVDAQPTAVSSDVTLAFAAAAVGGPHGLTGDDNCGQCYEMVFTPEVHPNGNWGGSHPNLAGKRLIAQVTNIGYDVSGAHSFDLQIPGAGQGIFTSGCVRQFSGYSAGDFDCDNNYGGCNDRSGCDRLPTSLQSGCFWRFDWYYWMVAGGQTNNPYVRFRRVRCPAQLVSISGAKPLDDDQWPAASL